MYPTYDTTTLNLLRPDRRPITPQSEIRMRIKRAIRKV